jgi:hypothetical protein
LIDRVIISWRISDRYSFVLANPKSALDPGTQQGEGERPLHPHQSSTSQLRSSSSNLTSHITHNSAAKLASPTSFLRCNSNRATAAVLTETSTVPLHCSGQARPSPKRVKAASAEGQTRPLCWTYLSSSSESRRPFRCAWMELWDGIVASVEISATTVGVTLRCLVEPLQQR